MTTSRLLKVTTPSDREIAMTRVFHAPRALVFDALTKPELVKRWLGAFGGWSMAVCEIDLRVGGAYRYVWRGPAGEQMGMRGVYREVVRPERIVSTEAFDEAWYAGGGAVGTVVLVEQGGQTTLTTTVRYASREVRDAVLKSPMESGVAAGYDKLAEVLASAPLTRATGSPGRPWRSAGAVLLGFVAVVLPSLGTDQILHVLDVYPPWGQPMHGPGLNLLALSYRIVYAVLGGYVAARFAPRNPMRHAVALGIIGLVVSGAGAVAAIPMNLGPAWYPIALAVTSLPCAWLGGVLYRVRQA